ncbi:MAG: hypothetical protein ABI147_01805 [Acidobacteriaceae bacterium]
MTALTPDQALLVFFGKKQGVWKLKRITGWATVSPHEEDLELQGFHDELGRGWLGIVNPDLTVSPDGRYAIARVRSRTSKIPHRVAMLSVVDLTAFKAVSSVYTDNPMLAGNQLYFNTNGTLFAVSRDSTTNKKSVDSTTDRVAVLAMPGLQPSLNCTHRKVYGPIVHTYLSQHQDTLNEENSGDCAALMKLEGAPQLDRLYPNPDSNGVTLERVAKTVGFRSPPSFGGKWESHCNLTTTSAGEQLGLYDCVAGHETWYDTWHPKAHEFFVVDIVQKKIVGSVSVPPRESTVALLASEALKDYLLILENGNELSVYSLRVSH